MYNEANKKKEDITMSEKFTWSFLMHLGFNMWADPAEKDGIPAFPERIAKDNNCACDYLRCDRTVWNETVDKLQQNGCNMIVIDLGEGVQYESHPEISAKGAWSKTELSGEIARLRSMGFEVIPKLNFATSHDEWLGIYSRMVSTPEYYRVCGDLIDEVSELFGNPRLFHLGMDEECLSVQSELNLCVIRHGELFWHDLFYFAKKAEANGARPWIWADYIWLSKRTRESFISHMTKDILCSNWYYYRFDDTEGYKYDSFSAYEDLEKHGFDQIPTASNCYCPENLDLTVEHSKKVIAPERLKGFMMTTWRPTLPDKREILFEAADLLGSAKAKYKDSLPE